MNFFGNLGKKIFYDNEGVLFEACLKNGQKSSDLLKKMNRPHSTLLIILKVN